MLTYEEALARLMECADEAYKNFHKRLLKNESVNVLGVRVPILRKLAKEWKNENVFAFPDEYYEITFLKCTIASALPYEKLVEKIDEIVALIDNWATCDCFAAPCIEKHRDEFLTYIEKYLKSKEEFVRRFGLVTLLRYYVDETYLPVVIAAAEGVEEGAPYYVMMAAAWLAAEVAVKYYERAKELFEKGTLSKSVQNKGIQKARESFRLTKAQKAELNVLKR